MHLEARLPLCKIPLRVAIVSTNNPLPHTTKWLWPWSVIALLAIVLTYGNSFHNGFHFDDFHTVVDNPAIRSMHHVSRFFTDTDTFSVLPANRTYRPMVTASLALDYMLGRGYDPFWFHISTFLVFLGLLYLLCLFYDGTMRAAGAPQNQITALWALATATWFGLHPAIAETINYIIQRGDLYVTTGSVAALVAWIYYPRGRKFGIYLVPLILALLSKPPAAVFPFLLFFWIYFFEAHKKPRLQRWLSSLLKTLPAICTTLILMVLQSSMTPKSFLPSAVSGCAYRLIQPYVWLRYCVALFLPLHLNVDTDLQPTNAITPSVLVGFAFVLLLGYTIFFCARRHRLYPIAYGLLWFVITQLPTSLYPLSEVENDHRMCFSFVGLMLAFCWLLRCAVAWLLAQGLTPQIRRGAVALSLFFLSSYAWGTHQRNRAWKTEESLWQDDIEKCPRNGRGHMNYGLALMARGDLPSAELQFEQAHQYTPNYYALEINLGIIKSLLGKNLEAESHFRRAIDLAPKDDTARSFYGYWLLQQGRLDEAAAEAQHAITLNPLREQQHDLLLQVLEVQGNHSALPKVAADTLKIFPNDTLALDALKQMVSTDADTWLNRSLYLYQNGQYLASEEAARKALSLNPSMAEAHNNLAASEAALGHWNIAIMEAKRAIALKPGLTIANNNLKAYEALAHPEGHLASASDWINRSLVLYQQGKFHESIFAAHEALQLNPHAAEAWNNIAAAEEALQHWDQAIVASRRALQENPNLQIAKNNLQWSMQQKQRKALQENHAAPIK